MPGAVSRAVQAGPGLQADSGLQADLPAALSRAVPGPVSRSVQTGSGLQASVPGADVLHASALRSVLRPRRPVVADQGPFRAQLLRRVRSGLLRQRYRNDPRAEGGRQGQGQERGWRHQHPDRADRHPRGGAACSDRWPDRQSFLIAIGLANA